MHLDLDLNLATFQNIDGFGCYHICINRFGLKLMIFLYCFATFGSLLRVQITALLDSDLGLQVTATL